MSYITLPDEFMDWQVSRRLDGLRRIKSKSGMPHFGVHTPVMATLDSKGVFPINLAYKGVGLAPKLDCMQKYLGKMYDIIKRMRSGRNAALFDEGLDFLIDFYSNPGDIDRSRLSSLELYGTKTFSNAQKDSYVGLCFNDMGTSYQVNCQVRIIPSGLSGYYGDFYRFVNGMHSLFHGEMKEDPPAAYMFLPLEVYDKSPGKNAGKRIK